MERQIEIEQQRARMQDILRNCSMALMVAVNDDGTLVTVYVNCSPLEILGLREKLYEGAKILAEGEWSPIEGEDDD